MVLAHEGAEADHDAGQEVPAPVRPLHQAGRRQHRRHGDRRLVELVARQQPQAQHHSGAGQEQRIADRAAHRQQPAPQAQGGKGSGRQAQPEQALAGQRRPCRRPVVAAGVVGVEVAQRHLAMRGGDGAVPEEALLVDGEVEAALGEQQGGREHQRQHRRQRHAVASGHRRRGRRSHPPVLRDTPAGETPVDSGMRR